MPTGSEIGHVAVVPPREVTNVPPLDPQWLELFAGASASDVSDAVGALYTMSAGIGPLYRPTPHLLGRALTVKCWPGDNLAIYGALDRVTDGDVLVVDTRGYTGNCGSGANVLSAPRAKGLRGVVIDGAWRDVDDLAELGFPMFGRGWSPFSPAKRRPGEINVPVHCGGVVVHPGDLVVGDGAGVAVVPSAYISTVWDALAYRRDNHKDADSATEAAARGRGDAFDAAFENAHGVRVSWPAD